MLVLWLSWKRAHPSVAFRPLWLAVSPFLNSVCHHPWACVYEVCTAGASSVPHETFHSSGTHHVSRVGTHVWYIVRSKFRGIHHFERLYPRRRLDAVASGFWHSYGTYGPAFEDGAAAFPTPVDIPLDNFYSCGDCVFPGVGVPAVAVSGANVANSCVGPFQHLRLVNRVQRDLKSLKQSAEG